MKERCGYHNKNDTCNCTLLCKEIKCIAIKSNHLNVEDKALNMIENGFEYLKEIKQERKRLI